MTQLQVKLLKLLFLIVDECNLAAIDLTTIITCSMFSERIIHLLIQQFSSLTR